MADFEIPAPARIARERTALGLVVICAGGFMDAVVVLGFFIIGAFGHYAAFAVSALFLLANIFVGDYARDAEPFPKGA